MKLTALLLAAGALCCAGAQAQQSPAEVRLRDQLRQTTTDLRQAQDENAELKLKLQQAQQPAAPAPAAKPAPAVDDARLRSLAGKAEAESARAASLQQQLDQAQKALEQWKQAYEQAVALARGRDAEAKKYQALYTEADTHGKSCEADNVKLVQIGGELLDRYKHKGVWSAVSDAEPLTGLHRIEMEKLAQDYHARIVDATVQPAATP